MRPLKHGRRRPKSETDTPWIRKLFFKFLRWWEGRSIARRPILQEFHQFSETFTCKSLESHPKLKKQLRTDKSWTGSSLNFGRIQKIGTGG